MGFSGLIAGGIQSGLDEVAERRLKEAIRQQQEQQAAAQLALQTRQIEGVEADRAANRENERRTINLAELTRVDQQNRAGYEDTARANMSEMIGNPQQLQAFSMASGVDVPKTVLDLMKVPEKPKPVQYTYTDPKTGNRSMRFADPGAVPAEGLDMGNEPQRPTGSGSPKAPQWVTMPDGSTLDINNVAPKGSRPFDSVATRQQNNRQNVHPQLIKYSQGLIRKVDDLIGRDDDLETPENEAKPNRITNWTAGGGGTVMRNIPLMNNDAKNVAAELFSLTSELAIAALQKMRASSLTGGAIGNVALGEMEIMKNAEAAMRSDQSPENLVKQMKIIRNSEQAFLDAVQRDMRESDPGSSETKEQRTARLKKQYGGD